jgi:hypothetical protein
METLTSLFTKGDEQAHLLLTSFVMHPSGTNILFHNNNNIVYKRHEILHSQNGCINVYTCISIIIKLDRSAIPFLAVGTGKKSKRGENKSKDNIEMTGWRR